VCYAYAVVETGKRSQIGDMYLVIVVISGNNKGGTLADAFKAAVSLRW
jgi:hypothetical protein